MSDATISPDYRALQQELHKNPNYGTASIFYAATVKYFIDTLGVQSLSDYGAGKCKLPVALAERGCQLAEYFPYDPAFPEYGPPRPADLVCCIDVLEHIEEPYIDAVLSDLAAITRKAGFFTISTRAAKKLLPDGRNAHLIQQPATWWTPKLERHFEIVQLQREPGEGFWVLVKPREGAGGV